VKSQPLSSVRLPLEIAPQHEQLVCCIINKLTVGCDENYPHAS
jgi:hypothetical protein